MFRQLVWFRVLKVLLCSFCFVATRALLVCGPLFVGAWVSERFGARFENLARSLVFVCVLENAGLELTLLSEVHEYHTNFCAAAFIHD